MLKLPHYTFAPEMKPRNKKDELATDTVLRSRAATFDFLESLEARPTKPALLSTCFGQINRILLTIPNYVFDYDAYGKVYRDLFQKLPASVNYIILTQVSARATLDQWINAYGIGGRSTIVQVADYIRFTVWAEDAYAATRESDAGETFLAEPASFPRAEDALIADVVAAATDIKTYNVSLYYQGGNILIGDDFWLLGVDYANKSFDLGLVRQQPNESRLDALRRTYGAALDTRRTLHVIGTVLPVPEEQGRSIDINGETWTEVVYVATGVQQPIFHIDMFITLAGRDGRNRPIALVGDPSLAERILQRPSVAHAMIPIFDDIATKLQQIGFTVIRNPLPLIYQDDPRDKVRQWYFATANNALVQIDGSSKKVWLPSYGYGAWQELSATDDANRKIWRDLGFEVEMLEDFHPFAYNSGAVHCIKKYLSRG